MQAETTYFGVVPCLTIRKNTEKPITMAIETNKLVGTDKDRIITKIVDVIRFN